MNVRASRTEAHAKEYSFDANSVHKHRISDFDDLDLLLIVYLINTNKITVSLMFYLPY